MKEISQPGSSIGCPFPVDDMKGASGTFSNSYPWLRTASADAKGDGPCRSSRSYIVTRKNAVFRLLF